MIAARRPSGMEYDAVRVARFCFLVPSNMCINMLTLSVKRASLWVFPYTPKFDRRVSHSVEHSNLFPYFRLRKMCNGVAYDQKERLKTKR